VRTVQFIFGIHNHQPYGNLGFVLEDAYAKCYRPFLDVLERHPGIRMSMHFTGPLLEWIDQHDPGYFPRWRKLVGEGRVEVLGGAMYEPILSSIPADDQEGQILHQTEETLRLFGVEPRGMWLAERVWEPNLASVLANAGMEYTILDDTHFLQAGLTESDLRGYFLTEDQGQPLALFPISKPLRYAIPFHDVEESIDYLRSVATEAGDVGIVMADDGEKFGVWPSTHEHVYEDGWLEEFFGALERESDWLKLRTFSEYLSANPPRSRIYVPTTSYHEMGEWSLPAAASRRFKELGEKLLTGPQADEYGPFIRGGFWRNFLVKYPEINAFHKKMLYVSKKLEEASRVPIEARLALWRAQTNCPYWHGVFGGAYLTFLRFSVYRNLILAERYLEPGKYTWLEIESHDLDRDGHEEVIAESNTLSAYFKPSISGMLYELDYRPSAVNLLDSFTRRYEPYHDPIRERAAKGAPADDDKVKTIHDELGVKEEGLEKWLIYDSYERRSLIDHFLPVSATLAEFAGGKGIELGDFPGTPYEFSKYRDRVTLRRQGSVRLRGGQTAPIELRKAVRIVPKEAVLEVEIQVTNHGQRDVVCRYGSEWCVGLTSGDATDRYALVDDAPAGPLRRQVEHPRARRVALRDHWADVEIEWDFDGREVCVWRHPIETVSRSEAGYERVYQSTCVLPLWDLDLPAGKSRKVSYTVTVSTLS
jgi:alpha-amylase